MDCSGGMEKRPASQFNKSQSPRGALPPPHRRELG
ncbi:hypothetical protein EE612_022777 [Oryza sativa]|nr:hypothetical protein EE612_022777 [Oryza sativa]